MTDVSGQLATDQLALVALDRRPRKVRDLGVGDRCLGVDLAGQGAQPGAQNDTLPWATPTSAIAPSGWLLYVFPFVVCHA